MIEPGDRYHALGLRGNPFAIETQPGVPAQLWLDRGFSHAPAVGAGLLMQLLGEEGAGKTSHMLHWHAQTGGPYTSYPSDVARWRCPPLAPIAYWDEADRIPRLLLRLALTLAARQRATVVTGTHRDLGVPARQAGLAVQTVRLPPLTAVEVQTWAAKRVAAARLGMDVVPCLSLGDAEAAAIVAQAGGSWRRAGVLLHIWVAQAARTRTTG
ncbi:MAG TPA: hypothetical protein VFS21_13185 [Roseiflexaceae bacterium]|nr:hypothetical protein [Roseiflexaceae bacterium]